MTRSVFLAAVLLVSGCATTQSEEVWNDDSVANLSVGMTIEQVEAAFGKPSRTQTFTGNRTAYVYLRPSDDAKTSNKYVQIVSLGIAKTPKVDALSIMFEDGVVSDFKYEENADNNMTAAGGFNDGNAAVVIPSSNCAQLMHR